MPSWVKDEDKWEKSKEIVKDQYNLSEKDGDRFWKMVTGVYKKMGGKIKKSNEHKTVISRGGRVFYITESQHSIPVGMRKGDRIRIKRSINREAYEGTVWQCTIEPKEGDTTRNALYTRLGKDGKKLSFRNPSNSIGLSITSFEKYLVRDYLEILRPDETGFEAEVDIKALRDGLKRLGLHNWTLKNMNRLVKKSATFFYIDVTRENEREALPIRFIEAIIDFLDREGYVHDALERISWDPKTREKKYDGELICVKRFKD